MRRSLSLPATVLLLSALTGCAVETATTSLTASGAASAPTAALLFGGGGTTAERQVVASHAGWVKWYNAERGYGFISIAGRGDVFLERAGLTDPQWVPEAGDNVIFVVVQDSRGQHAEDVTPAL